MINILLIKWIKKGMFIGTQGSPLSSLILLTVVLFVCVFVFWLFPNVLHGGSSCLSPLSILCWLQVLLILTLHVPFHLLSHVSIHSLTHSLIYPVTQIFTEHLLTASCHAEAPRTQKCLRLIPCLPTVGERMYKQHYKCCMDDWYVKEVRTQ